MAGAVAGNRPRESLQPNHVRTVKRTPGLWVISGHFRMSDLCPLCPRKQTLARVRVMSALPLKADTDQHGCDVRFVPIACSNPRQRLLQVLANFRQKLARAEGYIADDLAIIRLVLDHQNALAHPASNAARHENAFERPPVPVTSNATFACVTGAHRQ